MELVKVAKNDDLGLGETDPAVTLKKQRALDSWNLFRKFAANFEIGGQARVGGKVVTLTALEPVGNGLIRVEGTGYDGSVAGNYKPGDLRPA